MRSLCLPNVLFADITRNDAGEPVVGNVSLSEFIGEVQDVHNASGWYERVTKIVHVSALTNNGGGLAVALRQQVGDLQVTWNVPGSVGALALARAHDQPHGALTISRTHGRRK